MTTDVQARLDDAVLRALADPNRRAIVERLAGEQLCVCHLVADLDLPQPLVSHHLRILREAGLVEGERFRYWTYYRLRPAAIAALATSLAALAAAAPAPDDRRRPCC
ncbi:MAG: metalloregulator ArsR/SmtB family transcription factor [Acidimicrobiia bacterium]|jgi:ArsR family transcriptional regulator